MKTREEKDEQIWLYAAGALEGDEAETVRRQLDAGDPTDMAALNEAQSKLAHLPAALEPVAPSAAVRGKLLARVAADASSASVKAPGSNASFRFWPAAIAALVAFGFALYAMKLNNDRTRLEQRLAESENTLSSVRASAALDGTAKAMQIDQLRKMLDDEQTQSVEQIAALAREVEVLRAPELKFTAMEGDGAKGRVFWDQTNHRWHVYVFDLAPPAPGHEYELWYVTPDQKTIPAGSFMVDAKGSAHFITEVPKDIGPIALAAVTEEPAGVPHNAPTLPIKLKGAVQ